MQIYGFPVSCRRAKNRLLYSRHKGQYCFFFLFFFFSLSFHPTSSSSLHFRASDSWSATFRPFPSPLPRNFQKAAQIQSCRLDFSIRNCAKWNHLIALHPSLSRRARLGRLSFDSGFVKNSKMIVPLVDFVPRQS